MENPEYLREIKEKIQKLKCIKDMLDCGSITNAEYMSLKDQLISENAKSFCDHDEIKIADSFSKPFNSWAKMRANEI